MTRLGHLTDSHLDGSHERGERLYRGALEAKRWRCDALAVTGDLTIDGSDSLLASVFDALCSAGWDDAQLFVIPGNHDPRSVSREAWWATMIRLGVGHVQRYGSTWTALPSRNGGGCGIVCLDTRVPARAFAFRAVGKLGPEQAALVSNAAETCALRGWPLVALAHHPPHASPLQPMDGMVDHAAAADLLRRHRNLYYLSGHDHRCLNLHGGRAFVAPAVVDAEDPLRVYDVEGSQLRSVRDCSPGKYLRLAT